MTAPALQAHPKAELRRGHEAGLLFCKVTITKEREVWNRRHTELRRQVWLLFGVYFQHNCLPCLLLRKLGQLRRCHFAWATPGGPKIDQHRNLRLGDDIAKHGFIDF